MRYSNIPEKPLISVIMPVYNAAPFLREAIRSIKWQTYKNWELIAVDDGSTDSSVDILRSFADRDPRIKVYTYSRNVGLSRALNRGLKVAEGEIIARMDADDYSLPRRFEAQLAHLKNNPELVAIGCQTELIDENGETIGSKHFPTQPKQLRAMMMEMMPIQHPTLMTYASVIRKIRYENHTTAEDVSLFFQLLQYGEFGNVPKALFQYRIRLNSNSLKDPKKTFYLTFASRIKAIMQYGYRPSIKGIAVNLAQLIVITTLPKWAILKLYETMRFKTHPIAAVYRRAWSIAQQLGLK